MVALIRLEPSVTDLKPDNITLLGDSFLLTNYRTVIGPPMGKITGLWLAAMTLLAVVAVSTAPAFGPGVAAASNHGTEIPDGPDIQVQDAGLIDERADTGAMQTPELDLWVTFENTGDTEEEETITVEVGGREVTITNSETVASCPFS